MAERTPFTIAKAKMVDLAAVPTVCDVANHECMLYSWQVEDILNKLEEALTNG